MGLSVYDSIVGITFSYKLHTTSYRKQIYEFFEVVRYLTDIERCMARDSCMVIKGNCGMRLDAGGA